LQTFIIVARTTYALASCLRASWMKARARAAQRTFGSGSERRKKSLPGPPMTLGGAAAAGVRLIVWCRDCSHQVEPDPPDLANRYGETTSVLDWRDRLVCSRCNSRAVDMVVTGPRPSGD
jgi:hypothetical protein